MVTVAKRATLAGGWALLALLGCSGGSAAGSGVSGHGTPAILSLDPPSASSAGPAFTLAVHGSNFLPTSVVSWNGAPLVTSYLSATELTAAVPSADIAAAGSASVTVANPAPAGASSAALFDVTAPGEQPLAPTGVTAEPWPYTAIVAFIPPASDGGVAITGYTATADGAAWISGSGPGSPIMVQGGPETWGGASYQFQVTATYSDGREGPASAPSNFVTPTGGTSALVYGVGVFHWEGDYSYGGTVSYTDQSGEPSNGPYDVMFTSTDQGGWQPWAPGSSFDLTGYAYLEIDLKPTTAGKSWNVYFEKVGDVGVGAEATLPSDANGTYGPTPLVGEWASYKIPLANMNVGPGTSNVVIYKFGVHDDSNIGPNAWYAQNVRFTAN